MAIQFASDKEKNLLLDFKSKVPELNDLIRKAWTQATHSGAKNGYFQVEVDGMRYMFLLRTETSSLATVHYIAQQARLPEPGQKAEFSEFEKVL